MVVEKEIGSAYLANYPGIKPLEIDLVVPIAKALEENLLFKNLPSEFQNSLGPGGKFYN
jgi:hypothetical protein